MSTLNDKALILTRSIERSFRHDGVTVLTLKIEYPNVILRQGASIQTRINLHYKNVARNYYRYVTMTLLPAAIEQYKQAQQEGYPFHPYEAILSYTVTMNGACTLSTYFLQYEYTGGAHGNTIRTSDNWELETGRRIRLANLFEENPGYRKLLIRTMQRMAKAELEKNPGIYFDDYEKLIAENFSSQNFNLTPTTLDIYYQQYEIAPYSTGIVVFSIPYERVGLSRPSCMDD